MSDQTDQTDDDGETQRDGSEDHPAPHRTPSHEQSRSERSERCQFDDFAMI